MTRTKKPRKNSSVKKEVGRSFIGHSSASSGFVSSRKQSDDLNDFLTKEFKSTQHFLKEFEEFYEKKLNAQKTWYEAACLHVKSVFEEKMTNLPENYLNSTVHSNFDEDLSAIENNNLNSAKDLLSKSQKLDPETNEFKRPKTPRVNHRSFRKRSTSAPPPMALSTADSFKTPTNSLRKLGPISVITPKVADTPMCVMRRPEHGEVAFAASGSPLLVGRISLEDVPTVTVPLQDGRIFSILPDPGAAPPILPQFDEETKRYLKTLREHLELLAPSP